MKKEKNIVRLSVRLNLDKDNDRKAWEYLRGLDKAQFKSCNSAVVTAINSYFERVEKLSADPYLETREKEDAFLRRVTDTIERSLLTLSQQNTLAALLPLLGQGVNAPAQSIAEQEQSVDEALDFANSF